MAFRQAKYDEPLLFESANACEEEALKVPAGILPANLARQSCINIPRFSEREVVRHFTVLSQMNFGVDSGFYPLGSCTMKYNPKFCDELASHPKSASVHPLQPEETVQGTLQIMYELQNMLAHISGMSAASLQPAAGAHGEFTGLLIARAFHEKNKETRTEVILPDTSHGTNPASASMAGFDVTTIPSKDGKVDLDALSAAVSKKTAAFMLTNPNTLGIFESQVLEISRILHEAGALLYYDGANLNAIMGKTTPGKMGFDIVHINLHKTFATPHGGGGPGSGPVCVTEKLAGFLPVPVVAKKGEKYLFDYNRPDTIGKVHGFYGNWAVMLRAYAYILAQGGEGLASSAEKAVLNSNYLRKRIEPVMEVPYPGLRKHEFVASGSKLKERGIRTMDVAKRLMDYGFHPPTVYFPMIVDEAMMVEPTETETKATLDAFAVALASIAMEDPKLLHEAPHCTAARRLNEAEAVKNLILSYRDYVKSKGQQS